MLNRFLSAEPSSVEELSNHIAEVRLPNPFDPFGRFSGHDMKGYDYLQRKELKDFPPTTEARFSSYRDHLPYNWSSRLLLRAQRPLKGEFRKLPYGALAIAQQVTALDHLNIAPQTYIGVFTHHTERAVLRHDGQGNPTEVALSGIFAYLHDKALPPIDADYRQSAHNFQKLVIEKNNAHDLAEANRLITPEFLAVLPHDLDEFNALWGKYDDLRRKGGAETEAEKHQADEFFVAMGLLGVEGLPDSLKVWWGWAYSKGKSYIDAHDALTASRLHVIIQIKQRCPA